jgi:hypothetical protein
MSLESSESIISLTFRRRVVKKRELQKQLTYVSRGLNNVRLFYYSFICMEAKWMHTRVSPPEAHRKIIIESVVAKSLQKIPHEKLCPNLTLVAM